MCGFSCSMDGAHHICMVSVVATQSTPPKHIHSGILILSTTRERTTQLQRVDPLSFKFQNTPIHNLVVWSTRQRFGPRLRLSPPYDQKCQDPRVRKRLNSGPIPRIIATFQGLPSSASNSPATFPGPPPHHWINITTAQQSTSRSASE